MFVDRILLTSLMLSVFLLLATTPVSNGSTGALPHDYEDGFIERTVALVIRDQKVIGELQFGLNETTADQLLVAMRAESQESRKAVQGTDGSEMQQTQIGSVRSQGDSDVEQSDERDDGRGPHLTDVKTIAVLDQLGRPWFRKRLALEINGQTVQPTDVQIQPARRHPYSVSVRFVVDLEPHAKPENPDDAMANIELAFREDGFANWKGARRLAAKVAGKTFLLNSNVAPILVRAKRAEIEAAAPLDPETGEIRMKLAIPAKPLTF